MYIAWHWFAIDKKILFGSALWMVDSEHMLVADRYLIALFLAKQAESLENPLLICSLMRTFEIFKIIF